MKTWKVLKWDNKPEKTQTIEPDCPHCGTEATLEVSATPGYRIIATMGMAVIFDPANHDPGPDFFPNLIQCRTCRHVFTSEEE